jgi:hypothetical protein
MQGLLTIARLKIVAGLSRIVKFCPLNKALAGIIQRTDAPADQGMDIARADQQLDNKKHRADSANDYRDHDDNGGRRFAAHDIFAAPSDGT